MPLSETHILEHPGTIIKISDSGTDIEYIAVPTGGASDVDGGNAGSTFSGTIDGGSA
jgi:hypothetical protein